MGQTQSQHVARQLQQSSFEELLQDDNVFLSLLNDSARTLSTDARSKLQTIFLSRPAPLPRTKLASAKLKPLLSLKEEDVRLSPLIERQLNMEWSLDYTQFFGSESFPDGWNAVIDSLGSDLDKLLRTRYQRVLTLEKRRSVDRLQWRFYTMFFYDLNVVVNGQNSVTARAVSNMLSAIGITATSDHVIDIERNLRKWISRGRVYRKLSDALGGSGCLFFLPETISDYLWEEALPLNGEAFQETCEILNRLSICEKASSSGALSLASTIEYHLWAPFQWNVVTPAAFHAEQLDV